MAALDQFIRDEAVTKATGIPRSTRYAMIARGEFPRPIHLSKRSVAWPVSLIVAWQQARIADEEVAL
jgi:prophage regulatory protein